MANSKLSALTAITTAADTDTLYVENTGTSKKITWANIKATLKTYLDTLYLSVTGGTLAGGTVTASTPVLSVTQTWNDAAVTFVGKTINITDTASASASVLENWAVGGVNRAWIRKDGQLNLPGGSSSSPGLMVGTTTGLIGGTGNLYVTGSLGNFTAGFDHGQQFTLYNGTRISFSSSNGGGDVLIARDAANTLAQRNGTNAQTNRLYGTYTDVSNYRRVAIAMTTAGVASIAPEGAGTGASGNVLHISGLPTANPGPGILWNDAGTVKVGT